jgi:hypothetical protein
MFCKLKIKCISKLNFKVLEMNSKFVLHMSIIFSIHKNLELILNVFKFNFKTEPSFEHALC